MNEAVRKAGEYFGDILGMFAEQDDADPEDLSSGEWQPTDEQIESAFYEALSMTGYKGDFQKAWRWAKVNDVCFMFD